MLAEEIADTKPQVRLRLFGRFGIEQDGAAVALPGRKACAMLAFLALAQNNTASRERLAGLLWTDRGAEQARASLRQSIRELRELAASAPAVVTVRSTVSLDPKHIGHDVQTIREVAAARSLADLARALDEVHGDFLDDMLDIAPGFDEWLEGERPRLHELVMSDALEALEACGFRDVKNARSILRSLDRLDPLNEAVVRLGMRIDQAEGDMASLHRRYRQLEARLQLELGVSPSEETRKVYQSCLAGSATAAVRQSPAAAPAKSSEGHIVGEDILPLVMVAPITHADIDPALAAAAAFCADDVRMALSRHRGIRVLAVEQPDLAKTLFQAGDALGLYLLTWSLLRLGESLRLTMQLVDAATRVIVWSDTLRFEALDEAALDVIVGKAAGAVVPSIDRDLNSSLRHPPPEFADERAMYTRARLLIRSVGHLEAVKEGVALLEAIVARNPRHLGSRLLLTRMYSNDFWQQMAGHDVAGFRERSELHLLAAASIEPGNCEVRIRQGWCHLRRGEIAAARREFERVLDHLPYDAEVVNQCAFGMCHIGLYAECERLMQRAFFLNPFPPSDYHADYAVMLALSGDAEAAEEHFQVSGETRTQYAAVRIANGTALRDGAARLSGSVQVFLEGFRSAWQQEREPALPDVLAWIVDTMPLHPPDRMEWLKSGLQEMLAPVWPADFRTPR